MTKRGFALAFVAAVLVLGLVRTASAQPQYSASSDAPQWLKDRRYNEGIGIRVGDLELHPGIAGEVGYDSNVFLRSSDQNVANGPPAAPIVPSAALRVTPSLYLSTLSPQRREEDLRPTPPDVMFRAGVNATYRALFALHNEALPNDPSQEDNVSGGADARVDILAGRPVGGAFFGGYTRVIQPNTGSADPNVSFNRDNVRAGAELALQPGSGTLDWHLGYELDATLFEYSEGAAYDTDTHQAFMKGAWRFRPRTALVYDGSLQFISYAHEDRAAQTAGLVSATPLRARLGLSGLVTERFALTAIAGYGASFLDSAKLPGQEQYNSVIGQAELKWYLAASPGISKATDLGLSLSSVAIGYTRDFALSYLGNYYGQDRGYLKFSYFFAGRFLATLDGGVSAIEYPDIVNPAGNPQRIDHAAFTDTRADATLFGEYRFTDAVAVNLTLRYLQNFSNTQIAEVNTMPPVLYSMAWQHFEAYLGARWFM